MWHNFFLISNLQGIKLESFTLPLVDRFEIQRYFTFFAQLHNMRGAQNIYLNMSLQIIFVIETRICTMVYENINAICVQTYS